MCFLQFENISPKARFCLYPHTSPVQCPLPICTTEGSQNWDKMDGFQVVSRTVPVINTRDSPEAVSILSLKTGVFVVAGIVTIRNDVILAVFYPFQPVSALHRRHFMRVCYRHRTQYPLNEDKLA